MLGQTQGLGVVVVTAGPGALLSSQLPGEILDHIGQACALPIGDGGEARLQSLERGGRGGHRLGDGIQAWAEPLRCITQPLHRLLDIVHPFPGVQPFHHDVVGAGDHFVEERPHPHAVVDDAGHQLCHFGARMLCHLPESATASGGPGRGASRGPLPVVECADACTGWTAGGCDGGLPWHRSIDGGGGGGQGRRRRAAVPDSRCT